MSRLSYLVGVVIALGTVSAVLLLVGAVRPNTPDPEVYPIWGVDVSHHQGRVRWGRVARSGAHFAYIKASEGRDVVDPRFERNWDAAGRAGLARGAYHFFTFCTSGREQARHFLATFGDRTAELPFAIDVEFHGNCPAPPGDEQIRAQLSAFLAELEEQSVARPVLYATRQSYRRIVEGGFEMHALWVRDVFGSPGGEYRDRWLLWQHSDRARVPGVAGMVDRNVFRGSPKEWAEFSSRR